MAHCLSHSVCLSFSDCIFFGLSVNSSLYPHVLPGISRAGCFAVFLYRNASPSRSSTPSVIFSISLSSSVSLSLPLFVFLSLTPHLSLLGCLSFALYLSVCLSLLCISCISLASLSLYLVLWPSYCTVFVLFSLSLPLSLFLSLLISLSDGHFLGVCLRMSASLYLSQSISLCLLIIRRIYEDGVAAGHK